MKIGANLWIWVSPFRTDEHLRLITQLKSFGAEAVEFALEDDAVVDARAIRRVLEDEALGCSLVGLWGPERDLSHIDGAIRQRGISYAKHCLDVSADVGASILTGSIAGVAGQEFLSTAVRQTRIRYAAESLQQLGQHAAEVGVRIGVEVLNRYENNLINTAKQARELVDLTNHEKVGIHLDTFHMNIEETCLGDAIRLAGDELFHFHCSDTDRRTPGQGHLQWKEIAVALNEVKYDGYSIIESFNTNNRMGRLAHFWHPPAQSPATLARDGIVFLKRVLRS
jgi:D-psicose/D-tagatose/L-ribulose 3-epimerase